MQSIRTIRNLVAESRRKIAAATYVLSQLGNAPRSVQLMLLGAVLYGLLPIDLLPDFIPGIGVVDDLAIVAILFVLAWRKFREHIGQYDDGEAEAVNVINDEPPIETSAREGHANGNATRVNVKRRPTTAG